MELKEIFKENDFTMNLLSAPNLSVSLGRKEIESVLTANKIAMPLASNMTFTVRDNNGKYFVIKYILSKDMFVYNRLAIAK